MGTDALYFVDVPIKGSLTIADCTMTYDVVLSYRILRNEVTKVRGSLTFSSDCSGSVDFDIELKSNINELPVIDVDVNNKTQFEQFLVKEINQAIINNQR